MAVKASNSITLSSLVDVKATYRYYLLQSSTLTAPTKPTAYPPASTWDDTEPTYTEGSTNSLYMVDCTVFSDDTFAYSEVSLSSSYEAAKVAYNKAVSAQNTATENAENITSLTETVLNQNTEITATCESIILEATKDLVATGDFESFQQTVSSQLEVLNNEITMKFTAANEELQTMNNQLVTKLSQYEKHISFSENGIGIRDANGEQVMELWLDSGLIKFIRGGQEFGHWDGENFHTGNIYVENKKRVQLGPYAFVPRTNGHMSLLKVE